MLTVPEASARILSGIAPLPPERVALLDAVGRVLATDAVATYTLPHWDNSAMDGYAVRAADIAGATSGLAGAADGAGNRCRGGVPHATGRGGHRHAHHDRRPAPGGGRHGRAGRGHRRGDVAGRGARRA